MSLPNLQNIDITEILRGINNALELKICVKESVDNGDGTFTISTCNTYYLNSYSCFEVDGNSYRVVSFLVNQSITYKPLEGAPELTDCFVINNPYYLVGTPRMTSKELEQLRSNIDRLPLIWLLEPFASTNKGETNAQYDAVSNVTLFFFNAANRKEMLNVDHRREIVTPIKGLINAFLLACTKSKVFGDITKNWTSIDRIDYGNYQTGKGHVSSILPETLSGVEIRIEFPILGAQGCFNLKCN